MAVINEQLRKTTPCVFQGCWRIATLASTSQMPSIKLSWRSVKYYPHHLEYVLHYTSPFFQVWVGTIDCIRMISVASRSEKQSQCRSIKRNCFPMSLQVFLVISVLRWLKKKKHDKLVGDGYIHFYKHTMIRTKG